MITIIICVIIILSIWSIIGAVFCLLMRIVKLPTWMLYIACGPIFWFISIMFDSIIHFDKESI